MQELARSLAGRYYAQAAILSVSCSGCGKNTAAAACTVNGSPRPGESSAVGCGCTKAAPMWSSHKQVPTCSPKREDSEKRPTSHLRSPAIMPITRWRSRTVLLWPLELRARLACMLVGGIIHQGSASIFRKAFSHCGSRRGAPGRWRSVRPRPGGYRIWNTSKATRENSNIDAPVDVAMTVA